jgi:hypothetical protein
MSMNSAITQQNDRDYLNSLIEKEKLRESLQDILSRFESAVGCGGKIEGDEEAIKNAKSLLEII